MRVTAQEISAALTWGFRPRRPTETVEHYREQLIDHVENRNVAAAFELRLGRKRADWTQADQEAFRTYLLQMWRGGPSDHFSGPVRAFQVVETMGNPVNDESLRRLARVTLDFAHETRLNGATQELPVIASVLCTDGRFLSTYASRDERKAILKLWIDTEPVFGYVMFSDAYIHRLDLDPTSHAVKDTTTTDALMMHVGSRTGLRELYTWVYRLEGKVATAGAIFETPEPVVMDKSKEQTQDPYADLFASATAPGVQ